MTAIDGQAPALGIVAIGRNEGERLRRCLHSLARSPYPVVYVDSGSSDDSRAIAGAAGALVHELDPSRPFTAARARDEGLARLIDAHPALRFVQFVDGDCEVAPDWIELARETLEQRPELAAVCGRRRERSPEASVYNRLCDVEWDTPVGLTDACGGDALMRVADYRAVGGFDHRLIAGEEPDLCLRLRRAGRRILRLDAEMTIHDAALTRCAQWWSRARRAGHTAAEGLARQGLKHDQDNPRRVLRAVLWAGVLPLVALVAIGVAFATARPALAVGALAVWCALCAVVVARTYRYRRRMGTAPRTSLEYALFTLLGKAPELAGMLLYLRNRAARRTTSLIEYKRAEESGARR